MYQAGDIPLAGDWNNDGIVSIGLFHPGGQNGTDYFYLSNLNPKTIPTNSTISGWNLAIQAGPGSFGYVPIVGDWTGTGKTKLGVFRPGTTPAGSGYLDTGNFSFASCSEDQCPSYFGGSINGVPDKPVAFGRSVVRGN